MEQARIFQIQHFSVHDGPGIRTTVFFKGCNLRCWWCHNPESWECGDTMELFRQKCIGCGTCGTVCPAAQNGKPALLTDDCTRCGKCAEECYAGAIIKVGRTWTLSEVLEDVLRDRALYDTGGGVTCSGGEPLLQPDFLEAFLRALQENGIHTAIETALCVPRETVERIAPHVKLIYCDIKSMHDAAHRAGTGASNRQILENIRYLCENGHTPVLRTPVIPGFNDTPDAIRAIGSFAASLPGNPPLELLPFHGICSGKYEAMGLQYRGDGLLTPTKETMEMLCGIARDTGANAAVK